MPGSQRTLRLRARAIIAKTRKLAKGVCKLIKTKRTPKAANYDDDRGFGDALDPYLLAWVGRNAGEVLIQPVYGKWITKLWFPLYYPKMVALEKNDHVTRYLDDALLSRDHRAHALVSTEEVPEFRKMV